MRAAIGCLLAAGLATGLSACMMVVPVGMVRIGDTPSLAGPSATQAALPTDGFGRALNAFRAGEGRGPIRENARLAATAQAHASDMATQGYFSHRGENGSSLGDRVRAQGCRYRFAAENIAKGQRSEGEALQGWIDSPGHRSNLLNAQADSYGLGRASDTWVLVLGRGC